MADNPVNHPRAKHIDVAYHYVRNKVADELMELVYIPITDMVTDGLIKPLEAVKFGSFRSMMGMSSELEGVV